VGPEGGEKGVAAPPKTLVGGGCSLRRPRVFGPACRRGARTIHRVNPAPWPLVGQHNHGHVVFRAIRSARAGIYPSPSGTQTLLSPGANRLREKENKAIEEAPQELKSQR
jgi:hypothetical protein